MSKTDEIIQNKHHYWLPTASTSFLHIHSGQSLTLNVNQDLANINPDLILRKTILLNPTPTLPISPPCSYPPFNQFYTIELASHVARRHQGIDKPAGMLYTMHEE